MSNTANNQPHTQQAATLKDGTTVILRSETQVPAPQPQSKDTMFNVTQAAVYLGFVILLITSVGAAMKWLDGKLEKLGARMGDDLKEMKQDVKAAEQRILNNEKDVVALDKRLALQEAESRAIKAGQDRIEDRLEKMEKDGKEGRAEIIDSIREISKRELRP